MGYDAIVPCRCVAGRLADAPAEFGLSIDPCGRPETGFDWSRFDLQERFDDWRAGICSHGEFGALADDRGRARRAILAL